MACPYFLPRSPLKDFSDLYTGECAADGVNAAPQDLVETCCNYGYARAACSHAAQSESDAFRFIVKSESKGTVQIAWSSERNHHPVAVGNLSMDGSGAAQTPLELQAQTVAAIYLRHLGL